MNEPKQLFEELTGWSPFEKLLAELSARFVNLHPEEVDVAIEDAQRIFCEWLGLDRSSLFLCSEARAGTLLLTHMYQVRGLPVHAVKKTDPVSGIASYWRLSPSDGSADIVRVDGEKMFPWFYAQLQQGKTVVVEDVEALGNQAFKDKEFLAAYGTKSTVVVPLFVDNKMLGVLSFAAMRQQRDWPEGLVTRFQFIANLFTNALARKEADESLRESEARFRIVADSAPVLIWMSGRDKLCIYFNKPWLDFTGRTHEQELGNGWTDGVHPEDLAACVKTYAEYFDAREPFTLQYRLRRRDGEYRWVSDHGVPRYDNHGKFAGYIGSCVDIHERKNAVHQLQQAAAEWRATFNSILHPVMLLNRELRVVRANTATYSLAGTTGELAGKSCCELLRRDCAQAPCPFKAAMLSKRHEEAEIYDERERRWVREMADPIFDESNNLQGMVFSVEDVTERKQAEENLRNSFAQIERLKNRLQAEADYLKAEIRINNPDGSIVGQGKAIKKLLHEIAQVAPTDSTVLICGDTGTGKELVAEAIHSLSPRKERLIVKVNCAALPQPLVESELFGREKGAYTGALAQQVGRFEVADRSSIFLDEIGELSPEAQAKLLRVLQEGRFERLGSPKTVKVNVRLIAATNRDLAEDVRKGRFRQDLFYRLNVFPIRVPALRERLEDIPLLVWTFVEEFCGRMGKKITKIPRKTMESFERYSWPGNVRELRNVIERSVIISAGDTLRVPQFQELQAASPSVTLESNEREHILRILEATMWHIKGPQGAASRLGVKPSTLYSRMQKLGIPNQRQRDGTPG